MEKKLLLTFVLISCSFQCIAQFEKLQHSIIQIDSVDCTYKFSVLMSKCSFKIEKFTTYFWYANNQFFQTQGGYDGRLLDGKFTCFDKKGNLIESGDYSFGKKVGEWRKWYASGKIQEDSFWKKGKRDGKYESYFPSSNLKCRSFYKDDTLDGKLIEYFEDGKLKSEGFYKKGKLVIKVPKVTKMSIAKPKDKPASNTYMKDSIQMNKERVIGKGKNNVK